MGRGARAPLGRGAVVGSEQLARRAITGTPLGTLRTESEGYASNRSWPAPAECAALDELIGPSFGARLRTPASVLYAH